MKTRASVAFALLVAGLTVSAQARDVSISLPVDVQQAARNLPAAFDQCIAGATLRGDMTTCKLVGTFIGALANEVSGAQAKADADEKAKAEAEEKKKAEEPQAR